jgi:hypothetical protein
LWTGTPKKFAQEFADLQFADLQKKVVCPTLIAGNNDTSNKLLPLSTVATTSGLAYTSKGILKVPKCEIFYN